MEKFDSKKNENMIHKIADGLEAIARAVKDPQGIAKTEEAIKTTRDLIKHSKENESLDASLKQLDSELATWESKLSVILKEPVGKEGMVRHVEYWIGKLKG